MGDVEEKLSDIEEYLIWEYNTELSIEEEITQHKLDSRLELGDKIKWITPIELLKYYGEDIHPVQREIILQDMDMRYPIKK